MEACAVGEQCIDQLSGPWWVLHTRARNEKAVATALARQGVRHYLPLVRVGRTYGRRKVTAELPLFPGYVFACGEDEAREAAWRTNRVASILPVKDQERLQRELRHVRLVVDSGEPADLFPALREGRLCRVIGGSLKGVEGVVLRRRRRCRIYIAVTILGQSAVVELDSALLEPID